jgi:hypothetical protein
MAMSAPNTDRTPAQDLLTSSRLEQGLPPEVEDDAAIEHIKVLLSSGERAMAR